MTTQDFLIALFYAVDQEMPEVPKQPEAKLSPSEVVTFALLFAIKGGGMRAFYLWWSCTPSLRIMFRDFSQPV